MFGSFCPRCLLSLLVAAIFLPAIAAASPQAVPSAASGSQSQSGTPPAPGRLVAGADNENSVVIPRLPRGPVLEDFLTMKPEGEPARAMAVVSGFVQREPHDGEPVSKPTQAYLGYDQKNLYVVFVCYDDPAKVRAHETRREDFYGDDDVEVMLDTFHDRRRAYAFQVNPKGVQWDAIWTEQAYADTGGNFDTSFDTVWYSKGKLTAQGYVVWIAIPFRSLRFSSAHDQNWGIILLREIVRDNEAAFWPHISINKEGRLGQAGTAKGMSGISPGRNIQLIPYGLMNSFQTVDDRGPFPAPPAPQFAHYQDRTLGGTVGMDGKVILNDSLVLDATANPDFSQVESDEPQVTVNQRFRVFFPEKRPFFIENADYFRTPIDLFFTRNIVDPDAGIRLTGRAGPYALGFLSSDDRAPGLTVAPGDALFKTRSFFNIARVSRDLFKQSSIGAIYADWEYPAANSFNRVGGIDARLKFSPKLTATLQGVVSSTQFGESYSAGPEYKADLAYTSRHWLQDSTYNDVSPGFFTQPGFVNRVDLREYRDNTSYYFRPKHGPVVSWGPEFNGHWTWDHTGLRLDTDYNPDLTIALKRQTRIYLFPYEEFRERLRPSDPFGLSQNQDFHEHTSGINVSSSPVSQITLGAEYFWGDAVNFVPGYSCLPLLPPPNPCTPVLNSPYVARSDLAEAVATFHPFTQLKIDNTYLFSRLRTQNTNLNIFNNHILRSKWNWQFTRELSLRVILQYNATLTRNPSSIPADHFPYTSLPTTKEFNTDILITYLLHPGTALYIGYNTDQQNLDRSLDIDQVLGGVHHSDRFMNDGRLFFVKVSYLFRF
ncbi:MAG: DUF5916 domain-containing protein [Terriglobales bacterium]